METTDPIVLKIHKEFDNSVDEIKNLVKLRKEQIKDPKNFEHEEYAKKLMKAGFINAPTAKVLDKHKSSKKEIKVKRKEMESFIETIEKYSKVKYKFILYSQVVKILEKYNLYLSNAKNYIKAEDNLQQIIDYCDTNKIPKTDFALPLCANPFNIAGSKNLFIVAPRNHFKKKLVGIGKELIESTDIKFTWDKPTKNPKKIVLDPVVLCPVNVEELNEDEVGFYVVTKWGPEAELPEFTNPTDN